MKRQYRLTYSQRWYSRGRSIKERISFKFLHAKLFKYWDTFNDTTEQLLEKVAKIYTNFNAIKYAKNANDSRNVEIENH
jgi:hypothetical protein